jgi:hypothetical protein
MSELKYINRSTIHAIVLVMIMVSISACSSLRPNARILNQAPKDAPALYQQGWRDGCESGMTAGNEFYKAAYHNKINSSLMNNPQYSKAWIEANRYCAHYTMATLWESGLLGRQPSEETLIPAEPKNVFAVMASWGPPTVFNFQGNDPIEEEGEGFAGFYR